MGWLLLLAASSAWPERISLRTFISDTPRRFGGGVPMDIGGAAETITVALDGGVTLECRADELGVFANVDAPRGILTLPLAAECPFRDHLVRVDIDRDPDPLPASVQTGPTSFDVSLRVGGMSGHSFPVALKEQTRRSSVRGVSCDARPQGEAKSMIGVLDEREEPVPGDVTCRLRTTTGGWVEVTAHLL